VALIGAALLLVPYSDNLTLGLATDGWSAFWPGALCAATQRPRKSMLFPALIRLKVFSVAMLTPAKTASLKTAGSHRGVEHPRPKGAYSSKLSFSRRRSGSLGALVG